jgi:ABC-2 type transport system ATP-binding protein
MSSLLTPLRSRPPAIAAGTDMLLVVEGVEKRFGNVAALRGVTFQVARGERVALLGPNGAGKTTLVRAISGRLRLDAGRIQLVGRAVDARGALDELGVVPQDLAIYGDLSARENLLVFGRLYGLKGAALRQRVAWALEWIGLSDRQHQLTRTFSGGMKRRVNIACGVLHAPSLLLLDEPTVGVDP